MNNFNGMRVIESVHLTQDGKPYQVRRSWRFRLFSLPWRPWQTTYTVVPRVPYKGAIQIDANTLIMHPETVRYLRRSKQ